MNSAALSIRELSVILPLRQGESRVVDRVSFELEAGQIAGLAGESGCGKTMLALALMGLVGSVGARVEASFFKVGDVQAASPSEPTLAKFRGEQLAMIFQEPATALDPVFSVGWQLRCALQRRFGLDRSAARTRAMAALAETDFTDAEAVYSTYPHQLSGGMRQMVMIAMGVAMEPRVLIADEPTTALDVTTRRRAMSRLRQLAENSGTAILLISHDIGLIAEYCPRISVMYRGRIVESAPYEDFYHRPRHPYSAGLLAAVPRLQAGTPVKTMKGMVAPANERLVGCHFAPRCDQATTQCREKAPKLIAEGGRSIACHHPL